MSVVESEVGVELLTSVPEVIAVQLLSEWMCIQSITRLDSAMCGANCRVKFMKILSLSKLSPPLLPPPDSRFLFLFSWMIVRNFKFVVSDLELCSTDDDVAKNVLDAIVKNKYLDSNDIKTVIASLWAICCISGSTDHDSEQRCIDTVLAFKIVGKLVKYTQHINATVQFCAIRAGKLIFKML